MPTRAFHGLGQMCKNLPNQPYLRNYKETSELSKESLFASRAEQHHNRSFVSHSAFVGLKHGQQFELKSLKAIQLLVAKEKKSAVPNPHAQRNKA